MMNINKYCQPEGGESDDDDNDGADNDCLARWEREEDER